MEIHRLLRQRIIRKGQVLLKRMIRGIHSAETMTAKLMWKMEINLPGPWGKPSQTVSGVRKVCHADLCDTESTGEREGLGERMESPRGAGSTWQKL